MRSFLVLLVTLTGTLAACSPVPPPTSAPPASPPVSTGPPPSATLEPSGTLVVQQSRVVGGMYIEGAFAYVEVTDEGGAQIQQIEDPEYHLAKEVARLRLPAGRYRVETYVRPCEAACPALDEPTDRCEATVDLAANGTVDVQVRRQVGRPCTATAVATPRCPERPFDATVPLGPEFAQDIFFRDESEAIATAFLVGLEAIYADPATADICAQFTEQGWREALAFDPRLRAVERGESIVTQDHVLMIAFESTYDLRERPPVVPLDIVFDVPAGSKAKDVSSGETRTSTSDAREGFHADFMFDGHRWRVDRFGPIGADYREWAVMPTMPPAGPPCTGFKRDPRGAPFDEDATRRWCDADGRGRWIQQTQLVLFTRYPCDAGNAAILTIGRPLGAGPDPLVPWEYVRDPAGEFLAQRWLTAPYDGDVTMPEDAAYSGWTNGNIDLWISPSDLDRAVYLARGDTVERWPRAAEGWGVIDCN